ncbi:carboxylesterase family protein [Arthrobacter sp. 2MCAF15]|uniref:carboxylesterase family protein n=1 Tax=Arthrobacter sp. 2MCAF15 TaxID=3232984 RepID=UPI003F8E5F55
MSATSAEPLAVLSAGDAVYVKETHDGVVSVRGVRYGERLDPADRFSALGDPSPERPQAAATVFPQGPGSLDWLLGPALSRMPQSEDSFLLDIWAPEGAKDLPVLVFLPGGAFISGAGNVRWYDGARLAREGGAVVVTVNYRLGALGLLGGAGGVDGGANPGPRNLAAGDILQALTWIHRNIEAFGGNPGATTLAGHSAGAWYAYVLSFADRARGLFRRTALFSLPWQPPLNAAEFAERSTLFAAALGTGDIDSAGDGAGAGSPEPAATTGEILAAQAAVSKAYAGRGLGLMPAADGEAVPSWAMDFEAAAAAMHVDALLLSSTDDEAAAFLHALPVPAVGPEQLAGFVGAHYDAPAEALSFINARHPAATDHVKLVEAMSLHQFRLAATELAGQATQAGIPATLLRFSVRSRLDGAGSPHCFELPFLFGNRPDWEDAPMLEGFPGDVFDSVSDLLQPLLLGFVADGVPRTPEGHAVPRFDPRSPELYVVTETGAGPGGVEPELRPRR